MRVKSKVTLVISIAVLSFLGAFLLSSYIKSGWQAYSLAIEIGKINDPQLIDKLRDLLKVYSITKNEYVEDKSPEELIDSAMRGMISGLDPYSHIFIGKDEVQKAIGLHREHNYAGVGLSIIDYDKDIYVAEVFDGYPAAHAGIKAGDRITNVDAIDIAGMKLDQVSRLIRGAGKEGTNVTIQTIDSLTNKPAIYLLIRQKVRAGSVIYKNLEDDLSYIKIRSFDEDTHEWFLKSLIRSGDKAGLIIDLRNNGGGLLRSAIEMVSYFVGPSKTVIVARGRNINKSYLTDPSAASIRYPKKIIVLTNKNSASASEAMVGALRHYGVIQKIIGETTYGKGVFQHVLDVDNPDKPADENTDLLLMLTASKYYLPDGTDINSVGIKPDIEISQPKDFRIYEYLTERDLQYRTALYLLKKN